MSLLPYQRIRLSIRLSVSDSSFFNIDVGMLELSYRLTYEFTSIPKYLIKEQSVRL